MRNPTCFRYDCTVYTSTQTREAAIHANAAECWSRACRYGRRVPGQTRTARLTERTSRLCARERPRDDYPLGSRGSGRLCPWRLRGESRHPACAGWTPGKLLGLADLKPYRRRQYLPCAAGGSPPCLPGVTCGRDDRWHPAGGAAARRVSFRHPLVRVWSGAAACAGWVGLASPPALLTRTLARSATAAPLPSAVGRGAHWRRWRR